MHHLGTNLDEDERMMRSRQRTRLTVLSTLAMAATLLAALIAGLLVPGAARAEDRSRAVSGWFGYWTDTADMAAIARASGGVLGEVNIFWWNYSGPVNPVCTSTLSCPSPSSTPWASQALLAAARQLKAQGIEVYATHTDLDSGRAGSLSQYLSKKQNRLAITAQLTDWAVKSGVDGVDLDWENFAFNDGSDSWATTRPRMTSTVRLLAKRLHAAGLKLSVTVPGGYQPFLTDGSPNPGGGYSVYNWAALAPHVDRLRLMTYDYSWNRPGPIGPHYWTRDVVKSAIAQVGEEYRKKIYVGLHQYGKAWYDRDAADDYVTIGECDDRWEPNGEDATSVSLVDARKVAKTYDVTPTFDRKSREWFFNYVKTETGHYTNGNGKKRVVDCKVRKEIWYGAKETAVGRMQMVKRLRIGGVAVWQLAGLDSGFFPAVKPYVDTPAAAKKSPGKKSGAKKASRD